MASIEEQWIVGRFHLEASQNQWQLRVLPKNKLTDEIISDINNTISELHIFLDSKPKTEENLRQFQVEQDRLCRLLNFASIKSGFNVVMCKI